MLGHHVQLYFGNIQPITISNAGIATPRTVLQEKWGIEDSEELIVEDLLKAGLGVNNLALVKTVVANANDVLEWTEAHYVLSIFAPKLQSIIYLK